MRLFVPLALIIGGFAFAGCDNRTQEGVRWDQIAQNQNGKEPVQPWQAAKAPWGSEQHREGTAW